MYPVLFNINGLKITSYGFALMCAFLLCNYLLKRYLKSIDIDPSIGDDIIFYAAFVSSLYSFYKTEKEFYKREKRFYFIPY